jgi:hypothetical protein
MVPNFDDFVVTFESGMKRGLESKTRAQRHHDSNRAIVKVFLNFDLNLNLSLQFHLHFVGYPKNGSILVKVDMKY